jgi:hypothetical protein
MVASGWIYANQEFFGDLNRNNRRDAKNTEDFTNSASVLSVPQWFTLAFPVFFPTLAALILSLSL